MRKTLACLTLGLSLTIGTVALPTLAAPLRPVNANQLDITDNQLGLDDQLWGGAGEGGDKRSLLIALDHSIRYMRSPKAAEVYRNYPVRGITQNRVLRSLVRFRQLVVAADSSAQLQASVKREFALYQSVGKDGQGAVFFTGYYEPIHLASRVRTAEYRYPLYQKPPDIDSWLKPHPTRIQLEGEDGLQGSQGPLRGLELFWLRDRLEAYLVQIQGSAQLRLTDGTTTSIGYDEGTDYPYTSIGKQLIKDGILPADGLTMPVLIDYFRRNPLQLSNYLPRNNRFVFFRETNGAPAMGSINVPVTPERSIATDKSLMPPGALALIHTRIPFPKTGGKMEQRLVSRYVLDQDTGSAIKGPGRVDYYMGTGDVAGDRAGVIGWNGQLYYLLLKE
jgi:membrane-bound lytic murein transglycosylase A